MTFFGSLSTLTISTIEQGLQGHAVTSKMNLLKTLFDQTFKTKINWEAPLLPYLMGTSATSVEGALGLLGFRVLVDLKGLSIDMLVPAVAEYKFPEEDEEELKEEYEALKKFFPVCPDDSALVLWFVESQARTCLSDALKVHFKSPANLKSWSKLPEFSALQKRIGTFKIELASKSILVRLLDILQKKESDTNMEKTIKRNLISKFQGFLMELIPDVDVLLKASVDVKRLVAPPPDPQRLIQ